MMPQAVLKSGDGALVAIWAIILELAGADGVLVTSFEDLGAFGDCTRKTAHRVIKNLERWQIVASSSDGGRGTTIIIRPRKDWEMEEEEDWFCSSRGFDLDRRIRKIDERTTEWKRAEQLP